jgi:type IV pilus assembly protein PilV
MLTSVQTTPSLRAKLRRYRQRGATLIESLVAILVLSFGLLAIGGMMAYAVQLPKMAGNRAVAIGMASDLVERMRANVTGYAAANYDTALTYDGSFTVPSASAGNCTYPNCTASLLAIMDLAWMQRQLRLQLPAGGFSVQNTGGNTGNLWVLWQDPDSLGNFSTSTSDNCPSGAASYTSPRPRCVFIPFKL